ncbi:MAG: tetratricopeptide repeat protein [Muribaculaceae bacterium]|nr:tetratricopeptide repeat protein [Muribaculaceae bacterium]
MRYLACIIFFLSTVPGLLGQINTDQVLRVGQNALYFEDYMLSIQYFNRVIQSKPYLAQPYLFRAIAKLNLEDYAGAEADATTAIEYNPYLTDAWEVRGVARQNLDRLPDAVSDYDHALELLPRNRQLLFNKALAEQDMHEFEKADSTFGILLSSYPGYDSGYLGRARLRLEQQDTVGASADIEKALSINKSAANAYILRADIAIHRDQDFARALDDMNEAVKLLPRVAGLYINRAYLRYKEDDYFGAMADYEYALQLEPLNTTALFNRALLEMETQANDRALADLDRLIELNPSDSRARYNRAVVNNAKGRNREAIEDISYVIAEVPELPDPYFMRSRFAYEAGDMRAAERDYNRGMQLSKNVNEAARRREKLGGMITGADVQPEDRPGHHVPSDEETARRFASLLTVDDNANIQEEYNNTAIRGKVQDRNLSIEPLGWLEVVYYAADNELRPDTYYTKEIDDLNATRMLRGLLRVTRDVSPLTADESERHFKSIEQYNLAMSEGNARAIDYIGRGLDYMTIHDYASAARDFTKALELTPGVAAAHLLRAQAEYHQWQIAENDKSGDDTTDAATRAAMRRKYLDDALTDLTAALDRSPNMAQAWYNKAVAHIEAQDFTSALAALNRAIECHADMGEAWYNRGYIYLSLGNERLGLADLSRAGQLGILPAYNLIKRFTR